MVIVDGEISKSDGTRGYDGHATSMANSVVRVAARPTKVSGTLCIGLTMKFADDHSFPNGYWIGFCSALPRGTHRPQGANGYLMSTDCGATLAIDEGTALVYREQEVVHSFGPLKEKSLFGKARVEFRG